MRIAVFEQHYKFDGELIKRRSVYMIAINGVLYKVHRVYNRKNLNCALYHYRRYGRVYTFGNPRTGYSRVPLHRASQQLRKALWRIKLYYKLK